MNLFKRGMIFLTFFCSCLTIALFVAAMGTKFWVVAQAKRISNPAESDGKIHFGLFEGKKELNVGYGWRTYDIKIVDMLKADRDFLLYGVWIGTIGCIAGSLLFACVAAVFAVINTATTPIGTITGVPGLYLWNCLATCFGICAVCLWAIQFHQKLRHNVMAQEDLENKWTSENRAFFGYSFWFVVVAVIIHIINTLIIYFGTREARERKAPPPMLEEKTNGAIMLY